MKFEIFQVLLPCTDGTLELNQFIASHRITAIRQYLVNKRDAPLLVFVVEYFDANQRTGSTGNTKIDYRQLLSADQFVSFSRLRDLRKRIAEQEGVPVYTIFTNAQLAEIVQRNIRNLTDLKSVSGIGKARIEKFGDELVAIVNDIVNPIPDTAN